MEIDAFVSGAALHSLEVAKGLVLAGDEVLPQVMFLAKNNGTSAVYPLVNVQIFFESKESKSRMRPFLKECWKKISYGKIGLKLLAVMVVNDMWVEETSFEEGMKMFREGRSTPFQVKPGMAEAIGVQLSLAEGDINYQWEYVRGENEIVFAASPTVSEWPKGAPLAMMMGLWPLR